MSVLPQSDSPLSGVRVLDLTQIYQGPYAAFLMAMAGAEVIKVEPIGGERMRGPGGSATPMAFAMLNTNKKSITLDLKSSRGKELLLELVDEADVLLENFAVGTMDRLGIGWEQLKQRNPALIYATGTGYGLKGPDSDLLAMDHTIQAASGILSVTGDEGQPPMRAGGAPCDIMSGAHMYAGVLTALFARGNNPSTQGKGTRVEVSMLDSMYFTLSSELSAYHSGGKIPERNSRRTGGSACPYGRYECMDGWIALICVSDAQWARITQALDKPDWAGADRFKNAISRRKNEAEIEQALKEWAEPLSQADAFAKMRALKVPVAPVRNIEEVRTNPHMHASGMLSWINNRDLGEVVLANSPIQYESCERTPLTTFPRPGEHNAEVLQDWLGMDASDVEALVEEKVI
ncbi:MAG: CoA transferase [Pseudomonadales bacterium]|nr:CoA transferase [Pseudomonadales bacterium]